jgi:hypothetical protein
MTTTGTTPFEATRAMITGYEEVEAPLLDEPEENKK